jgi:hypothetical protein
MFIYLKPILSKSSKNPPECDSMRGASEFRQGRNIAGSAKNGIADAVLLISFITLTPGFAVEF